MFERLLNFLREKFQFQLICDLDPALFIDGILIHYFKVRDPFIHFNSPKSSCNVIEMFVCAGGERIVRSLCFKIER